MAHIAPRQGCRGDGGGAILKFYYAARMARIPEAGM
jgi:hypothetical protein